MPKIEQGQSSLSEKFSRLKTKIIRNYQTLFSLGIFASTILAAGFMGVTSSLAQEPIDNLCASALANSTTPNELVCTVGADGDMTITTGAHTELDIDTSCMSLTADEGDQKQCKKALKPLKKANGSVTIPDYPDGFQLEKPILFDYTMYPEDLLLFLFKTAPSTYELTLQERLTADEAAIINPGQALTENSPEDTMVVTSSNLENIPYYFLGSGLVLALVLALASKSSIKNQSVEEDISVQRKEPRVYPPKRRPRTLFDGVVVGEVDLKPKTHAIVHISNELVEAEVKIIKNSEPKRKRGRDELSPGERELIKTATKYVNDGNTPEDSINMALGVYYDMLRAARKADKLAFLHPDPLLRKTWENYADMLREYWKHDLKD